jgi:hypothetical protein
VLLKKKIAIIGATSHLAKNIIFEFGKNEQYQLQLYARSLENVEAFVDKISYKCAHNLKIYHLNDFGLYSFDVVINCIGIGNPAKLEENVHEVFGITEYYDNLVIDYLKNKSNTALYINLSSGAAYGREFNNPVNEFSVANIDINHLTDLDYYGISKLYSETKHRSLYKFNIIDLRIFSFFSRFIDLKSKFLITEILRCLLEGKVFETGSNDLIRDYVSPRDFCNLVKLCIDKHYTNDVFDVYSLSPVSKVEIINWFHDEFGLKYNIIENGSLSSMTGIKSIYHSVNKKAEKINYFPSLTSLASIKEEATKILTIGG